LSDLTNGILLKRNHLPNLVG
jgi:hypothetical protein